ncbi:MAG: hypothetical protein JRE40_06825 [Deltaproteobacteria bacterium]|nr:hypothetical protein [Deltaproteobacteria bacterium]MBW2672942.1 hypothetical protein [Deltaproteobacteria bacterium]
MPVIVEYQKVKREYPEFYKALEDTRSRAIAAAEDAWGLKFGGMYPEAGQFGETPIRKPFFNLGTTSGTAETWNFTLANTGWQTLIDQTTIEDVYIGLVGWMFPSTVKRVSAIYVEAGPEKLPVVNVEGEIDLYDEPAIIYERGLVIPQETAVKVEVLANSTGPQIIKPLGFALAKQKLLIAKKPV